MKKRFSKTTWFVIVLIAIIPILLIGIGTKDTDNKTTLTQQNAKITNVVEFILEPQLLGDTTLIEAITNPDVIINSTGKENQKLIEQNIIKEQEEKKPKYPSLILITTVTTIDDESKSTTETFTSDFADLGQYIVNNGLTLITKTDSTNRPLLNGKLIYELKLKTSEPVKNISMEGTLAVTINNSTTPFSETKFGTAGNTDTNNELPIIIGNTGTGKYQVLIKDLAKNTGITIIKFTVKNIKMSTVPVSNEATYREIEYKIQDTTTYALTLERDETRVIIKDSQGKYQKVFATDDQLVITSQTGSYSQKKCSASYRNYSGCASWYSITIYVLAPPMGKIEVFNQNNKLVSSSSGTTGGTCTKNQFQTCATYISPTLLDILIQRNSSYTIKFYDPVATIKINTPIEQKAFSFYCTSGNPATNPRSCNFP